MSATSAPDANGITYVGVLQSGDSHLTQLSRMTSGYGTTKSRTAGPFNPRTGRLWFTDADHKLGSVDPSAGLVSERAEPGTVQTCMGNVTYYGFTPTGYGPVWDTTIPLATAWYFPNGEMMYHVLYGYAFGKEGTLDADSKPSIPLPKDVDGSPIAVIDNSAAKLLPESNKQILGVAVSPGHDQVAFMSSDGGLYMTGLTSTREPRKVMDLPRQQDNQTNMLLDWPP